MRVAFGPFVLPKTVAVGQNAEYSATWIDQFRAKRGWQVIAFFLVLTLSIVLPSAYIACGSKSREWADYLQLMMIVVSVADEY